MKITYILILTLLISTKIFSQSDSTYKTEDIFSLSYKNSLNKLIEDEDVKLSFIDSNSLTYETAVYDHVYRVWAPKSINVKFSKLNSFGYKSGADKGATIGMGALVGFGAGFILGAIEGKFNPVGDNSSKPSFADHIGTGFLFGVAFAVPGTLVGVLWSIPGKEYENLNISKYENNKKFEIIKRLIRKGVKKNDE